MKKHDYDDPFYSRDGQLVTDVLYFQAAYEVTKNPLYAWEAIAFSHEYSEDIPPFALQYIAKCAKGIISVKDYENTRVLGEKIVKDIFRLDNESYKSVDDASLRGQQHFQLTILGEYCAPGSRSTFEQGIISNLTDSKRDVFGSDEPDVYNYQNKLCNKKQKILKKIFIKYEDLRRKRNDILRV